MVMVCDSYWFGWICGLSKKGPKVGGCPTLFSFDQLNRVNSCSGSAMITAPWTLLLLLMLL